MDSPRNSSNKTSIDPGTRNSSSWLSGVLGQRLGLPLNLAATPRTWTLSCRGRSGEIVFDRQFVDLVPGDSSIPCSVLNVSSQELLASPPERTELEAPGLDSLAGQLVERSGDTVRIRYDIPGLCFWALTRVEELGRTLELDAHQRFPSSASHASKHGYLDRPIVDEWIGFLASAAQELWRDAAVQRLSHSLVVSHDVDDPLRYGFARPATILKRTMADVVRERDFLAPWKAMCSRARQRAQLNRRDPYNTFDWIMDLSDKASLKSTFYFITQQDRNRTDPRFDFGAPSVKKLLRAIGERGHEVGLHPSYDSFLVAEKIASEADSLKRLARECQVPQEQFGARMHYLQWRMPETPSALAAAGLTHDSSMGYADAPGFRCGTCYPYPGFDPVADVEIGIEFRPLIVMEVTMLGSGSRNGDDPAQILTSIMEYVRRAKIAGGACSLLWHNSRFTVPEHRWIYQEVLKRASR